MPSGSHPSGWCESTVRICRAHPSCGQVMAWDMADWPAAHTELDLMSISLYHLQGLSHERHLVLKRALAMAHTIEVIKLLGSGPQFPSRPSLRFPPALRPHCSMQSPREGQMPLTGPGEGARAPPMQDTVRAHFPWARAQRAGHLRTLGRSAPARHL